jgi:hypothetical protein
MITPLPTYGLKDSRPRAVGIGGKKGIVCPIQQANGLIFSSAMNPALNLFCRMKSRAKLDPLQRALAGRVTMGQPCATATART